jgi:hypothetical protein
MMIGIGTPRSQSKIPRPKLPSSCCVGANSVRAMNFEAPQFVPGALSSFAHGDYQPHSRAIAVGVGYVAWRHRPDARRPVPVDFFK